MKYHIKYLLNTAIAMATCVCSYSQTIESYEQKGEFGIGVGAAHYFGDINNRSRINRPKPALSLYFRKNFSNYIALRISASYAQVGYSDRYSKNIVQRQRNLSFNSNIWEGAAIMDFNFFAFVPGVEGFRFTPYLSIGAGFFNYDPYAFMGGKKYYLRKLGTEGQNLPDSLRKGKKYGPVAICFPLGMGVKYAITRNTNIGFEIIYRVTSTDYLDDVSTQYVGNSIFPQKYANGTDNPAYLLQDRSYEFLPIGQRYGDVPGRQRGNSKQKDHYVFAQVTLSLNFSGYKCPSY